MVKKIIINITLIIILISCNKKGEGPFKEVEKNRGIFNEEVIDKVDILRENILEISNESIKQNYRFMGNLNLKETVFIDGDNMIIPIYPRKVGESITLSVGIFYNLQNEKAEVLFDNIFMEFKDYQEIILKGKRWIDQTQNINLGRYDLSKKLFNEKVSLRFPQGKTQEFEVWMNFLSTGKREVVLEENSDRKSKMKIKFKEKHIEKIYPYILDENINSIVNKNIDYLNEEVKELKESYEKLNQLLN